MLNQAFDVLLNLHKRSATIERAGISAVLSGYIPATSATLASTISAGVAYINGNRVALGITNKTYTAQKDTYIDLTYSGVISYVVVNNGDPTPSITANSVRIAKVVTDLTSVTTVTMIATYSTTNTYAVSATSIYISPSNYFRHLAGPEEMTISGREFVISKKVLDSVYYPIPKKGDRLKDSDLGTMTLSEVREMFDMGGKIIGYRVRIA